MNDELEKLLPLYQQLSAITNANVGNKSSVSQERAVEERAVAAAVEAQKMVTSDFEIEKTMMVYDEFAKDSTEPDSTTKETITTDSFIKDKFIITFGDSLKGKSLASIMKDQVLVKKCESFFEAISDKKKDVYFSITQSIESSSANERDITPIAKFRRALDVCKQYGSLGDTTPYTESTPRKLLDLRSNPSDETKRAYNPVTEKELQFLTEYAAELGFTVEIKKVEGNKDKGNLNLYIEGKGNNAIYNIRFDGDTSEFPLEDFVEAEAPKIDTVKAAPKAEVKAPEPVSIIDSILNNSKVSTQADNDTFFKQYWSIFTNGIEEINEGTSPNKEDLIEELKDRINEIAQKRIEDLAKFTRFIEKNVGDDGTVTYKPNHSSLNGWDRKTSYSYVPEKVAEADPCEEANKYWGSFTKEIKRLNEEEQGFTNKDKNDAEFWKDAINLLLESEVVTSQEKDCTLTYTMSPCTPDSSKKEVTVTIKN